MISVLLITVASGSYAKTILVLGDSISAGYGLNAEQGWVNLLQQKLIQENKSYQVVNDSISGDTSAGGLARIDKLLAQHKPAVVILELGANDGLRGFSLTVMRENLAQIIQRSRNNGAKVLLLGIRIPPNYGKRYTEMFYNVYATLAESYQVAWVPFLLADVALAKTLMQADGLHPNAQAQPIMLKTIWENLQALL